MTHRERVRAAIAELEARGVRRSAAAPWSFCLAWALGIPLPPLPFLRFGTLALFFGATWGVPMLLVSLALDPIPVAVRSGLWARLGTVGLGSAFFGSFMSAYIRRTHRSLALPRWKDYRPADVTAEVFS